MRMRSSPSHRLPSQTLDTKGRIALQPVVALCSGGTLSEKIKLVGGLWWERDVGEFRAEGGKDEKENMSVGRQKLHGVLVFHFPILRPFFF